MSSDYVPRVTKDDVLRVIDREFPTHQREAVTRLLNEYGTDRWHREPDRVRLAILKLSRGELEQVRHYVDIAKRDFREVVAPAEYPAFCEVGFVGIKRMAPDKAKQIKERDQEQYEAWLRGNSV